MKIIVCMSRLFLRSKGNYRVMMLGFKYLCSFPVEHFKDYKIMQRITQTNTKL